MDLGQLLPGLERWSLGQGVDAVYEAVGGCVCAGACQGCS